MLFGLAFLLAYPASPAQAQVIDVAAQPGKVQDNGTLDASLPDLISELDVVTDGDSVYTRLEIRPQSGWKFATFPGQDSYVDMEIQVLDGLPARITQQGPDKIVITRFQSDPVSADAFTFFAEGLMAPADGQGGGDFHWAVKLVAPEPEIVTADTQGPQTITPVRKSKNEVIASVCGGGGTGGGGTGGGGTGGGGCEEPAPPKPDDTCVYSAGAGINLDGLQLVGPIFVTPGQTVSSYCFERNGQSVGGATGVTDDDTRTDTVYTLDDGCPPSWQPAIEDTTVQDSISQTWEISDPNITINESNGTFTVPADAVQPTFYTVTVTFDDAADVGSCTGSRDDSPVSLSLTMVVVDFGLSIDSDNDNGLNDPTTDTDPDAQDAMEEDAPGKIVFVNHNDDDGDEVPDYAQYDNPDEATFVPVVITIPTGINLQNAVLTFTGPLASDLPSDAPTVLAQGVGVGQYDYNDWSARRVGTARLYAINAPGDARTDTDAPDDSLIESGEEIDATQFFAAGGTRTLWLEGVNEMANQSLTVRLRVPGPTPGACDEYNLEDTVTFSVVDLNIGVNNNNNLNNDDGLHVGQPDVAFNIDDDDELVEDQGPGFLFWALRDGQSAATLNRYNIADAAPMLIQVPDVLREQGFKFYLTISRVVAGSAEVSVFESVANGTPSPADRLLFLKDESNAQNQLDNFGSRLMAISGDTPTEVTVAPDRIDNEFLIVGKNTGAGGTTAESTVVLTLVAEDSGGNTSQVQVDSTRLTFRHIRQFWAEYNARNGGSTQGQWLNYPLENGRTVDLDRYPTPVLAGGVNDIQNKNHYIVTVHGYNNSPDDARRFNDRLYRRLFWIGSRGQLIGFSWQGDEFAPFFDNNVRNAFQSAPAFWELMTNVDDWAGGSTANVDVIAHSLGNLVVWEAARLHQHQQVVTGPMANRFLMVEAAVWQEAFDTPGVLTYGAPLDPDDVASYTVDEQQRMSWRGWFSGASASFTGVINSYSADDATGAGDSALLGAMRLNDHTLRSIFRQHYTRELTFGGGNARHRTPQDTGLSEHRFDHVPALMQEGQRRNPLLGYPLESLNEPIGAFVHPTLSPRNAKSSGWRPSMHSDLHVIEEGTEPKDIMWFPKIYPWYNLVALPNNNRGVE